MDIVCHYCTPSATIHSSDGYRTHLNTKHKFVCPACKLDMPDKMCRDLHVAKVHNQCPCSTCLKTFANPTELTRHYAEPSEPTTLHRCPLCGDALPLAQSLWQHCEQHHRFACPIAADCARSDNRADFTEHLRLGHHLFACSLCHMVFPKENGRRHHEELHCAHCRQCFGSPAERDRHLSEAHPGTRCSVCGELFVTEVQFRHHYNDAHRVGCGRCTMTFSTVHAQEAHVNLAHRVRCLLCDAYLQREMVEVHLDEVHRHRCIVCGLDFTSVADRHEHMTAAHAAGGESSYRQRRR